MKSKVGYYLLKSLVFTSYTCLVANRYQVKISMNQENLSQIQNEYETESPVTINQSSLESNENDELSLIFSVHNNYIAMYSNPLELLDNISNNKEIEEEESTEEIVTFSAVSYDEEEEIEDEIESEEEIATSETVPYINSIVSYSISIDNVTEDSILNLNLRETSSITIEQIDNFLAGSNLSGLGYIFKEMEAEYSINAMFLTSIAILESGWGTTRIAVDKNNLFGWGACGDDPYTNAYSFENKEECIRKISKHLSDNYLTEGAIYFNGYTIGAVNIRYCELDSWSGKIANIMVRMNNSCY